jgi:FAD/FMN-containing dehydrogenase
MKSGMAAERPISAWGRLSRVAVPVQAPAFAADGARMLQEASGFVLPRGLGRSYGDVALNPGGVIDTTGMDRLIAADWDEGVITAEAGLSLDALLRIAAPRGWFLPVTPGTRFVTLGGAVANDVHGKNHHVAGTFGAHVTALGLARSSGEVLRLTPHDNTGMFAATVGGLGLTGLILWVELKLMRIGSTDIEMETVALKGLDDFFRVDEESQDWPYTVAWIDCLAKGRRMGRGLYMRGRHAESGPLKAQGAPKLTVPLDAPGGLLNPLTLSAFNLAYRSRPWATGRARTPYEPFFYPLDGVGQWNRLYGPRGFYQFQGAVPYANGPETVAQLLETVAEARQGSFLTVLKRFGKRASPGLLSFPMPGVTFALDFPNRGEEALRLVRRLNDITVAAGGRLYPAKDAAMTPDQFEASYPGWRDLESFRDPKILSDFWRRVTGIGA